MKYRTVNNVPNAKVIVMTVAALFTPVVAEYLGSLAGVTEVQVVEDLLLGLVTAAVAFLAGYFKAPAAGDAVVPVLDDQA